LFRYFIHSPVTSVSEDLVQDVFFRILKYRHTYRARRPFAPDVPESAVTRIWTMPAAERNFLSPQRQEAQASPPNQTAS
jgi:hypothetical protein